ncbi:hypothetical protein [Oerskovia flava]|uniref:hypothetical protein n=1 Tax=Oerskovia flava TaxID=2986422 RepID=UPI00223F36A2|nr:hypothetical protein [Oerskovia sp. JB1-3-2]
MAGNIAAVTEQTRTGLSSTRPTGGRVVTPFVQPLPGQGRVPTGVRAGGRSTAAARAECGADLTAGSDEDDRWGS